MAGNLNVEVKLRNVRLSYPHLFKAQKPKKGDGDPKYNATFIMDKNTKEGKANIAALKEAMREVREAKWGENPPKLKSDKLCLRDGDAVDEDGDKLMGPEYHGMMYLSASNKRRPTVLDRDKTPLNEEDGVVYGGCFGHAIVRIWPQDNDFGKRINASIEGFMFYKDGDAFGAAPLGEEAFDDFDDDEDEDEAPRSKGKAKAKSSSRDEDDEDEEVEAPRKSKPKAKAKSRSRDDEDDDDDLLG